MNILDARRDAGPPLLLLRDTPKNSLFENTWDYNLQRAQRERRGVKRYKPTNIDFLAALAVLFVNFLLNF